jgi:ornithine cyclodeaminase/alanine dehydrogenase-like protein (mu-crystallin family)
VTLPPFRDGDARAAIAPPPDVAMAAIAAGMAALAEGRAQQPALPPLRQDGGGFFQPFVAALPADNVACVNWLTYHPNNVANGRPHSGGLLILSEFSTGAPLCMMDGIWIGHRRTAYVAALAVQSLSSDVDDVALIGPGAIAAHAIEAIAACRPFRGELRVCGRSPARAEAFCAEATARLGIRARPVADPRAATHGARLVLTSTNHEGAPFLDEGWLTGGTLMVMIDRLRVVTPRLLARADRIVTTSRESLKGWGFDRLGVEPELLGDIVAAGEPRPVAPNEIVLCDAGGLAIADLALASLLWRCIGAEGASLMSASALVSRY